ncbi:MAG TPA: HD domain-containing protein [Gammaproteobacteria bacterium]
MPDPADDLVQRAAHFGTHAHQRIDQRRKYTHQPYQVHLKAVAELVATVTDDPVVRAAAWLHDVVEDTPATLDDLREAFGEAVARLVAELTDVSRPGDGNRAERKALDRDHLAQASPAAKTVKLADLIDNARDICNHDRRFCRTFLVEMAALLGVLGDGDPGLCAQARKLWQRQAERIGLDRRLLEAQEGEAPRAAVVHGSRRVPRLFVEAFTAEEIAEPLPSFDAAQPAAVTRAALGAGTVAGVRRGGHIDGYVLAEDLQAGACGDHARPFHAGQLLAADAPLADVIHVLTRHEHGFVEVFGQVAGVVTRDDIQKPVVRMWLFGIITLTEMTLTELIRARFAGDSWSGHLSESRLHKAGALHAERTRVGQACTLLDCLQLGDKARIALEDPELVALFGFESRGAAKRVIRELESLRNHLAHAQDIVTHHWAQIARLAQRISEQAA